MGTNKVSNVGRCPKLRLTGSERTTEPALKRAAKEAVSPQKILFSQSSGESLGKSGWPCCGLPEDGLPITESINSSSGGLA